MAVPNNYIDKIKKDGDSRMISPAADMVRVDNDNFEGTDLDEVLDEVAQAIEDAGEGGYAPPAGGIPKTDLSQDVQTSLGKADTALQSYTETDPTVPAWAKQSTKPSYTASEVGAVPTSRTVNGKALNNNITLSQSDIPGLVAALAAKVSGIKTSDNTPLTPDSNGVVTLPPAGSTISPASNAPIMDGTANVGSSAKYAREDHVHPHDTTKANASDVYTKTQADTLLAGKQNTLTFDSTPTASSTKPVTSGGIKTYVDGKATITGITTSQDGTFTIALSDGNSYTVNLNHVHPQYVESDDLAEVATSGSYNDLSDKPTIPAAQVNADWNATSGVSRILNKPTIPTVPTKVSSFTNDAGYLTQHQSLANYYTKSEIDTKIGNIETLLASI